MPKVYFRKTIYGCFVGFVVQAIVNNFAPLLFLTFHSTYGIPLASITLLVTVNFGIQLLIDMLAVKFIDRIGPRASLIIAHAFAAVGLIFLAVLPGALSSPYAGLFIATVFYAIGGGFLEVIISPVMEACPTDNKETAMSMLHSYYCWGQVFVVAFSTLFFVLAGVHNYKTLAVLWAIIPIANIFNFLIAPMPKLIEEGAEQIAVHRMMSTDIFWKYVIIMCCAGACEQSVSQWVSTYAEQGLHVSKTVGDLAGPMFFAAMMGASRTIYGLMGRKLPLKRAVGASAIGCAISYLIIVLSPIPAIGLLGCGICGFSVGMLWPGAYSLSIKEMPQGGTALFALLALGGDIGCSIGPTYVGLVSSIFDNSLGSGILAAIIFPIALFICILKTRDEKYVIRKPGDLPQETFSERIDRYTDMYKGRKSSNPKKKSN